ncbi:serine protease inhibitor Cvsi-2-like [Saccostrea cucullata]|uniref:serine protease inhibitor Cvsi-2-like n=1 Tax=Saccostrea cuccullata TaxID=36930 RepID=UPI002ED4A241
MKVFLLLAVVVGYVAAESCRSDGDCSHTQCDSTSQLHCVHGICTCTDSSEHRCTSLTDCQRVNNWNCPLSRRHCIDGECRCTRL